jgi:hypothetical protein
MPTVQKQLLLDSGVRAQGNDRNRRHDVMRFHAFRKYANTMMSQTGTKPVIKELLMSYRVGLENSYMRPTTEEMLREYLKAVHLLTISEEKQLKHEVARLNADVADIDIMKRSYLDMKLEIEKRDRQIQDLYGILYKEGIIKKNEVPVAAASAVVDQ